MDARIPAVLSLISVHRQGRGCGTERVVLGHWQACAELEVRSIGSRRYGG